EAFGALDSVDAVSDFDELRHLRDAHGERDVVALLLTGPSAPVPLLVGVSERVEDAGRETELFGEEAGHLVVVGDHAVEIPVPGHHELDPDAKPVKQRASRSEL